MLPKPKSPSQACEGEKQHEGDVVNCRKRRLSDAEDRLEERPRKRVSISTNSFSAARRNNISSLVDSVSSSTTRNRISSTSPSCSMAGLVKSRPAKVLGIKSLSVKTASGDAYYTKTWGELKIAIRAILRQEALCVSQQQLFSYVKNTCNQKMAAQLYTNLIEVIAEHVKKQIVMFRSDNMDQATFLQRVHSLWEQYCQQMVYVRSIFLTLDRTYVAQTGSVLQVWDASLDLFRQHIATDPAVQPRLFPGVLNLVSRERQGEAIDRQLLSSLVHMLMALQMYAASFEGPFLAETELVYFAEGRRLLLENNMSVPDYLQHVDQRLKQEQERLNAYLDVSTRAPLITCVEKNLVALHAAGIISRGLDDLLDSNRSRDLRLLFSLFERIDGCLDKLCKAFNGYVKGRGSTIVMDADREGSMVQDLLDLKDKLDVTVEDCFVNMNKFVISLKDAFTVVVNQRANKPAELIAKFVDVKLRAGNKASTDEELDLLLDKVMVLFRFIQGKDFFEAFYQTCLAKRLLVGKSASVDAERAMLSKLKQECGPGYTNKMEGMFKDMELSKEISSGFKAVACRLDTDIELSVNILTMGHWPTFPSSNVNLLPQMVKLQDAFCKFYISKRSGRKLTWQNTLGHCVLKATFNTGKKELQVSLFQTLVLCLFNQSDTITFGHIQQRTGIEAAELKRTLQSLACGKARVITKEPKGKEVNDCDVFRFNKDFSHKLFRIKINQIQMKETQQENNTTAEKVILDRQYQIDAAIVRIIPALYAC
ncbi:cullin-4B-like isoform X2 [Sycon ciliatum]|uniref:cullin-4B-like isoform X2 n=1 Tax=Sycon ciliatum TaxID=27933 RepID=UPI0031F721C8